MNKIVVTDVTKHFGQVCALDQVNITLEDNKIYGLLGRNGAGKSTLLKIITNRIFADSGSVTINGQDTRMDQEVQSLVYLMSEADLYPEDVSVEKIFRWTQGFYPEFDSDYAKTLAKKFGLNTRKAIKGLSTGYSSIFKLILALSVNTPFVFFDEPVLGLDANHRELFYRLLIEKYSKNPCTMVISTHLIEEVSHVVEDIIIIKEGKIIRNESREDLLHCGYTIAGKAQIVDEFLQGREVLGVDSLGGLKTAYLMGIPEKTDIPEELEVSKMDLQKLFIQLTNGEEETDR